MVRFVKVRFSGSIRANRGIFLRVTQDRALSIQGYEVDKDGEEVQPAGFERRLRIIAKRAIIAVDEYEMDKTYATLTPVLLSPDLQSGQEISREDADRISKDGP